MRNFLNDLRCKMQRFMIGRYGFDELSKVMLIASVVCFLLSAIRLLNSLAIVLLLCVYFRSLSKNFYSRNKELNTYYAIKNKAVKKFSLLRRIYNDRYVYRYFKCKNCGAILRVPKGKGKITITCNVCKEKMNKKT